MERTQDALSRLRALIAEGASSGDGRLPPERELAGQLGVGRRSLRRALDVLEGEGRVLRRQGRGTFVTGSAHDGADSWHRILDLTNPLEVIEVRLAIEPLAARLSALRASRHDIETLRHLVEETRAANDAAVYERADNLFHRRIAVAARNGIFVALIDALASSRRDEGWQRLGENARCYKRQSVYADNHREIADAIAARDGERAAEAMYAHLSDVQHYIYRHAFPQRLADG